MVKALACLLVCVPCAAQQSPFVFYTPKDGLVNSRVRSIKQDQKGRMLFLTYGGLSVYDGTKFVNYSQQNGLATDLVNDVLEITPDSFLLATNTSALNALVNGSIKTIRTADNFCPVINHFLKSKDGNLYVSADEGFFIFKDSRFIRLPFAMGSGTDIGNSLDKIMEWGNFFLIVPWSGFYSQNLIIYDKKNRKISDINLQCKVATTTSDAFGNLWAATDKGIFTIDTIQLAKGKINLLVPPDNYQTIAKYKNSFILFDNENNLWLYGEEGVSKISSINGHLKIAVKPGSKPGNLADLFIDREGTIWIATDGNGVVKKRNMDAELLTGFNDTPIHILTLTASRDTAWFFNKSDHRIYRFTPNEFHAFTLTKKINSLDISMQGQKLFLSDQKNLYEIQRKNKEKPFLHPKTILAFKDRSITLGTGLVDKNENIFQSIKKKDSVFYLDAIKDGKLLGEYRIGDIPDQMRMDRNERLWVITRNGHLYTFILKTENNKQKFYLLKDHSGELPGLEPRSLEIDSNNTIWVGTRNKGVFMLRFDSMRLISSTKFSTANGLSNNFVYSLCCDKYNTVWAGTQSGLDKIFLENGHYIIGNISRSNNLFQPIHKIIVTENNTVWALTGEGSILKIDGSPHPRSSILPSLFITSISVNNDPLPVSAKQFEYKQNNLQINVASPSFVDEKAIRYSYLLKGAGNDNWSEPSNNPTFNFINLAPGNYTLSIKSAYPEEMYPPQMTSYSFLIMPPWWQTWWFRIGMAILGIGLLIAFIGFYYRRKLERQRTYLERQQAVEKERTRIATDMHDDFGAGLSRIKFLSETIGIKKQKQLPIEEDISKIREYSHEMIDKMGEIVWALNEKNDTLNDLLSYTRSYAVEYLTQNGIRCNIAISENIPEYFLSGDFRRNIYLSVKEALHNVVKHAQAKQVAIVISATNELSIIIHDDGIGLTNEARPFSNGLDNMKERMKMIGGEFKIESNNGTIVKLKVMLPV